MADNLYYNGNRVGGVGNTSDYSGNRNLLDNWHFLNPINQRKLSGKITDTGYFIDRWYLMSGSVEITINGLVLNGQIVQPLEFQVGIETTATALSTDGTVEASYDDSTQIFSIKATGQTVIAAKLEAGNAQTLYRGGWKLNDPPPNYSQELTKCQRFLLVSSIQGQKCWENGTNGVGIFFPTPVTLRSNVKLVGELSLQYDDSSNNTKIIPSNITARTNGVYFYVTASSMNGHSTSDAILAFISGYLDANIPVSASNGVVSAEKQALNQVSVELPAFETASAISAESFRDVEGGTNA